MDIFGLLNPGSSLTTLVITILACIIVYKITKKVLNIIITIAAIFITISVISSLGII
ncbi:hypothetical protein [Oribacterium sp. WCC10]|uniref:hypothetical protein n=1 Tax=Oribacterium sp. WCC10 TaxID=1855343 RepID=UPI0008EBF448|nr:hypothetical protein [Oribacterium sp. WCC10]SFG51233.1 hypothetical protein SAMN05216356_11147 [Oribacterium sp. WCC10]